MGFVRHPMIISMMRRKNKRGKYPIRAQIITSRSIKSPSPAHQCALCGPPGTFYHFDSLPKELRFMVWEFSIEPQVVRVEWEHRPSGIILGSTRSEEEAQRSANGHEIKYEVPAIMVTSRESRYIGMQHYTFCFKGYIRYQNMWFNFDLDTLHMEDEDALVKWCAQIPRANREPIAEVGIEKKPNDAFLFEKRLKHLSFEDMPWYTLDRGLERIMARFFGLQVLVLPIIPWEDERWVFNFLMCHLKRLNHIDAEMDKKQFEELESGPPVCVVRLDERQMIKLRHGKPELVWWVLESPKRAVKQGLEIKSGYVCL